jgi:periplasmic divalent cation tolerance protein
MDGTDREAVLVITTVADDAVALELSRLLVGEGLAACVTRSAVRSVYRWEEDAPDPARAAVVEDGEVMLVVKTVEAKRQALLGRLAEIHPYRCPELVVVRPDAVGASYAAWLAAAVGC